MSTPNTTENLPERPKPRQRESSSPWLPIGLLLLFYLIIGGTVVDYGESWDEQKRYLSATNLAAYSGDYTVCAPKKVRSM
jgi:hypothetical protein